MRFGFDFLPDDMFSDVSEGGSGNTPAVTTSAGYVDQVMDKDGNIYDIKAKGGSKSYTFWVNRTCYDNTDTIALFTGDNVRQTFVDLLAQDGFIPPTSYSDDTYILGHFALQVRGGAGTTRTEYHFIPAANFEKVSANSGVITWDYSVDGYWGFTYNGMLDEYTGGVKQHRRYRSKLSFTIGSSSSQDSFTWETTRLDNDEREPVVGYNVNVSGSTYTASVSNNANMHNVLRNLYLGACRLEDVLAGFVITHGDMFTTDDTYYVKPMSYSNTVLGSGTYGKLRVSYLVQHPDINKGEILEITDDVTFGANYSSDTHTVRIKKIALT